MRILRPVAGIIVVTQLTLALNARIGSLPPIGRFLDPFHGAWQNAEFEEAEQVLPTALADLKDEVRVVMDDRDVPHIFASNDHDLYFVQGYLTAQHRLWQMETQTRAAGGRLSEVIGVSTVAFDLEQRRIGMVWAAERALEMMMRDSSSRNAILAYTDGVNAYINSLNYKSLPLEYKLLDNRPEPWTPLKSSLLLKHMAKMLTGSERDFANTEALKLLGPELFAFLYPEQNRHEDPIIPNFSPDTSILSSSVPYLGSGSWPTIDPQPSNIGSNNWAVAGSRTASGNPILCNDPHLGLGLPSIWYEVQLHGPDINCYGVSLPGAPGVVIGFNEHIAWGVTNAGRDVKDYFSIAFEDETKQRYRYGDDWRESSIRIEEVKVRGGNTINDTVIYTHYGPVAHTDKAGHAHLALRWMAHEPSNELRTFYELNRAETYDDFAAGIKHFSCPGQNFVFADVTGNIALWQQGKFPLKPNAHGRFILNGADPVNDISDFIPQQHNPHMVNPERGFVSSANQPPTDSTYPYYYTGVFEEFRNRTINDYLRRDSAATIESMQALQLSNYNLLAKEALPLMMAFLDTMEFQNKKVEMMAYHVLKDWDFNHDRGLISPTVFQIWWDELNNLIYDELNDPKWDQSEYYRYSWEEFDRTGKAYLDMRDPRYVYPMSRVTIDLLKNHPEHPIFDHHFTQDRKDNARDLVYDAFYWMAMKLSDIMTYGIGKPHWGNYQGTRIMHLMKLESLSSPRLSVGGNKNAPNAMTSDHGPSWRMVVEMTPEGPKAFGVLPGGQSGNPGSAGYLRSLRHWVNGEYHPLHLLKKDDLDSGEWEVRKISSN